MTVTDTTATQGLLRTTSTDTPRLMATYLGTLAEQVDRRVATQRFNLRRSARRPFALLQMNTEVAFDANAIPPYVVFDTIGQDTAGLADLSVDPSIITVGPGWWCAGAYVHTTGFGSAASDTQVIVNVGNDVFSDQTRDQAIGLAAVSVSFMSRVTAPVAVRCRVSWSGASTSSVTTLRYAEMWAFKVRDL